MAQNMEDSVEQGRLHHLWYNSTQLYIFSVCTQHIVHTHTHTQTRTHTHIGMHYPPSKITLHTNYQYTCPKLPTLGGLHQQLLLPSRESYHPACNQSECRSGAGEASEAAPAPSTPCHPSHHTTHSTMPSHGGLVYRQLHQHPGQLPRQHLQTSWLLTH